MYDEWSVHIIFSGNGTKEREWTVDTSQLRNVHFLSSKSFLRKGELDNRFIVIPKGVIKTISDISPNVVIAGEYNVTSMEAFCWCKIKGVPYISLTDGTLYSERNFSIIKRIIRRVVITSSDRCIASSSKSKELQLHYGADEKKIDISFLTVDIERFRYKRDHFNNFRLLFVGSLIRRKGLDLLFNALSEVRAHYILTVVGNGPEKQNLINLAKRNGIYDNIVFHPFVEGEKLVELYKNNDVFVLPTREDCFGLVINEAMSASMPIVASKYADGAYDLIQDSVNGYIVDPYDSKKMSEVIESFLLKPCLVEQMGKESYKRIQEFSLGKSAYQYISSASYAITQKRKRKFEKEK